MAIRDGRLQLVIAVNCGNSKRAVTSEFRPVPHRAFVNIFLNHLIHKKYLKLLYQNPLKANIIPQLIILKENSFNLNSLIGSKLNFQFSSPFIADKLISEN